MLKSNSLYKTKTANTHTKLYVLRIVQSIGFLSHRCPIASNHIIIHLIFDFCLYHLNRFVLIKTKGRYNSLHHIACTCEIIFW